MELYLGLEPFAEVPGVLATLREAGFKTAILSNGSPPMLEALVERARLDTMFDAVLSADAVGVFKTHPKVYQYALELARPAGRRDFVPILQRLGRAWGVGLRHARRLVQPLRPAPRAPSGQPRLRDQDAGRTAGALERRTVLTGRRHGPSRRPARALECNQRASFLQIKPRKPNKSKQKSLDFLEFLWPIRGFSMGYGESK